MKRLYFLFFICFFTSEFVSAQTFGNEWIVFSQKYLKIKVVQNGIYRIDSTTISNALNSVGTSLSAVDARNFQLFHNGQEEYIFLAGDSDGIFNATDFLEFYGKRNDGSQDVELYGNANNQLNPYVNLYNDTSIYFLTWNSSITNLRYANPNDTAFSAYTPAPYFTDEEDYFNSSQYLPGVQNSIGATDASFIPSEGMYDAMFYYGQTKTVNVNTYFPYTAGPNAILKTKIGSHSNDWIVANDNHINISGPTINFDTIYDGYSVAKYYFSIPTSSLSTSTTAVSVSSINSMLRLPMEELRLHI